MHFSSLLNLSAPFLRHLPIIYLMLTAYFSKILIHYLRSEVKVVVAAATITKSKIERINVVLFHLFLISFIVSLSPLLSYSLYYLFFILDCHLFMRV